MSQKLLTIGMATYDDYDGVFLRYKIKQNIFNQALKIVKFDK